MGTGEEWSLGDQVERASLVTVYTQLFLRTVHQMNPNYFDDDSIFMRYRVWYARVHKGVKNSDDSNLIGCKLFCIRCRHMDRLKDPMVYSVAC